MQLPLDNVLKDASRLAELKALLLLDTQPEEPFDRLTRFGARLLGCRTALVCLVDDRRQFFKSAVGLPEPWATQRETPLNYSFCKHVVASAAPLVVEDARRHPLFRNNPSIIDLGVVAYLGVPLSTRTGVTLGSFCVIDTRARNWTEVDRSTMVDLAALVMTEIEFRATLAAPHGLDEQLLGKQIMDVIHNALHHAPNSGTLRQSIDLDSSRAQLTRRQQQIFDLLVHGIPTKEIARRLEISPRTVEVHRSTILHRLDCPSLSKLLCQIF
jgi:GAF domain-containing protein